LGIVEDAMMSATRLPEIFHNGLGLPSRNEISLLLDDEKFCLEFLFQYRVLLFPWNKKCKHCDFTISNQIKKSTKYQFRCNRRTCRKVNSLLDKTFFEGTHLKLNEILEIGYLWLCGCSTTSIISQTKHSAPTVCCWVGYIKQAIAFDLANSDGNNRIGGPGIIVEIDESKFGKRKYHRGHHVEGVWVVGAVERTPERRVFAVPVENRSMETLMGIILEHIEPGSIIYSDCWKGYSTDELSAFDFGNEVVNHSQHFVDPVTGVHTNTIEGTWNGIKINIPPRHRSMKFVEMTYWSLFGGDCMTIPFGIVFCTQ
jgi:transposase-like protein